MLLFPRFGKKYKNLLLAGIVIVAILIRTKLISGNVLLFGVNGGYYPLMVKNFLSSQSLPFNDAPLVFWIESLLSKVMFIFMSNHEAAILLSCKIVDAIFLPFAAIPIFSFAMRKTENLWFSLWISAFTILFFPVSYLLTGDMHKNALAIVWLCSFLVTLNYFRENPSFRNLMPVSAFLLLLALTHFGTFAISLLTIPLFLSPLYSLFKSHYSFKSILLVLLIGARGDRLIGMISNPFHLFEHPVLWYLIDGQRILNPYLLSFSLGIQILAILILINSIFTRKAIYWAALAVLLSSPIIGLEWYIRLAIMAHIPLVIAMIIQWKSSRKPVKRSIISGLAILTLTSVFLGLTGQKKISLSTQELDDLFSIQKQELINESDLIICSHGAEWWTAWILKCHIAQEQAVNPDDFTIHPRVFTMARGEGSRSIARGQTNFGDPATGSNAITFYEGQSLLLRQVFKSGYPFIDQKEKLISIGQVSQNKEGGWQVRNSLYTNPLIFESLQHNDNSISQLKDTTCRIYGRRKAFSLKIIVTRVIPISNVAPEI